MRDPVSVANTFQSYVPRFSRHGRASDALTKDYGRKRVMRSKPRARRGAIPKNWLSVNSTPPPFRSAKQPLPPTPVPACDQVFCFSHRFGS